MCTHSPCLYGEIKKSGVTEDSWCELSNIVDMLVSHLKHLFKVL